MKTEIYQIKGLSKEQTDTYTYEQRGSQVSKQICKEAVRQK